jgi:glycosyltransferase involved in cell wall biosynthesis
MKYIVIPHGSIDPFDLQKKRLLKLLLGPLVIRPYLNGARMILCSTQLESQRIETYGSKTAPYSIPWAVKSEVWDADRETVRRRLGIQSDEFVMIFLGRIDYKKGFPILIPAFSRLVESGRRSTLLIVGPDTRGYTNTVRKLLVSTGVNQHARVLAPVVGREKSELLAASDCFVLPSLNENFAVAVVEAMQHSLPVIISRNVYIHEAISESGAGIVCDYSVDSLFEAMKRIRDDPALRSQFAIAASQAGAKFTPQAMKDRYHELLMRVVNE